MSALVPDQSLADETESRFVVQVIGVGTGRDGQANVRHYNFTNLTQAVNRWSLECQSSRAHRVELMSILCSKTRDR